MTTTKGRLDLNKGREAARARMLKASRGWRDGMRTSRRVIRMVCAAHGMSAPNVRRESYRGDAVAFADRDGIAMTPVMFGAYRNRLVAISAHEAGHVVAGDAARDDGIAHALGFVLAASPIGRSWIWMWTIPLVVIVFARVSSFLTHEKVEDRADELGSVRGTRIAVRRSRAWFGPNTLTIREAIGLWRTRLGF